LPGGAQITALTTVKLSQRQDRDFALVFAEAVVVSNLSLSRDTDEKSKKSP